MPEYALISLNMPEHDWILVNNAAEYAWKCLNKLFRLCQGSQYAASRCNNIVIIVTDVRTNITRVRT